MLKRLMFAAVLALMFSATAAPLCQGMAITPVIIDDIILNPGEADFRKVTVINTTEEPHTYYMRAINFMPIGEEGEIVIMHEQDFGLATWIVFPAESVTLQPGEMQDVEFQVIVPQNADPGGHYAAVFASTDPPDIEKGVGISPNVGTLLLVRVQGDITEDVRLLEFHTRNNQKYFNRPPVDFDYRIENRGTVHVKPVGIVNMRGLFGQEIDANPNNSRSLPSSIRHIETTWVRDSSATEPGGFFTELKNEWKNFGFGKYKAVLDISYGQEGKKITGETSFWVIPWHVLLTALILIIVLVVVMVFYNKMVVATAMRKKKK